MAHIFISYTSSDRDWAFWIGHELDALGHRPHIHAWEISGGGDIAAWMESQHNTADHVLCVVSEKYLKAPYSSWERRAAQWAAATNRPNFALPVFVEACEAPTLLAPIKSCDLFGISEEDARARLAAFLKPAAKSQRGPFPGGFKPSLGPAAAQSAAPFPGKAAENAALSNVPVRVPLHFLGRDDALEDIRAGLARAQGRVAITALHGLRGVGKTTLAAAYAELHRGDYRATWWIKAQTEPTIRGDLVALGVRLGWIGVDDKEEPAVAVVMERLRQEGEGVLLIFDNAMDADAIRPYLPRGGRSQILVTSNTPAWRGVAAPIEIRVWPKQIGADYLVARTSREEERADAEALSEVLAGLPLAHEQAAAYCERLDVSLAEYRKRFEAAPTRLLDDQRDAPAEYYDRLTVAKTFALAIEEAAKRHPAAEPLIVYAALLAPEPVPLSLFTEAREKFGEPLASALAGDGLDEAVAGLRAFALVDRERIVDERNPAITTDTIRLHRLVHQVAAGRREDEALEEARRALVNALAVVYPQEKDVDNPNTWPSARRLDELVLALVGGDVALPSGAEASAGDLLNRLVEYRNIALGASVQTQLICERALAIREKVLGPEHPDTATSLNNLAVLVQAQGDLVGARPLLERALAIREKVLGPEHPDTATSLSDLAVLVEAQGDLVGARPLKERALAICEKVLGPEHPDTATRLNNLASLVEALGDLVGARPLKERALAIREKVLGPEHPDTATSLNNLAVLVEAQGDLVGARPLKERALAIREKVLGPEHPNTATSLNNLAVMVTLQGDLVGARLLFERALAIREKVLGPEHPTTATSLNNLACVLRDSGHAAEAEPLFRKAIRIAENTFGLEHVDVATHLSNLAVLLRISCKANEAELLFGRAIAIGEKALGPKHALTQRYQSQYARLLLDTGRSGEAVAVGEAALATHEAASGLNHPWTRDSARVTADALDALGRTEEAKTLRERYGLAGPQNSKPS
jgi:tetratricopeptide (TPR) repeat protein